MSRAQAVMGFTEAELGLFLVLVLLAAAVGASPSGTTTVRRSTLDSALARGATLDTALQVTRDSLQRLRDLRSRQTPTCRERKVAEGPLFTVTVLASNRFHIGNEILTLQGIHGRYGDAMGIARTQRCRHQIRVRYDSRVNADDLWTALRVLRKDFNTDMEP